MFISINSIGQNIHFIKSYGNTGYDFGRDIKQDLDTGYIATGSSSSFAGGTADAFLLKVDSLGNFKWSYNYGGQETDWGESVVITHDSSYAIGGYTNSFGAGGFDFYLVRANKDGTPLWQKTYGGTDWDRAHSIIQLADSGFVLVGDTYSYGNGNADIYMVRTDKYGDTLWTRTYGGPENDFGNAVILDGDSLVVVGGTESFGSGMSDGIILKYHIDGTFGWVKIAGKDKDDYFTSIDHNISGNYSIGGSRNYNHFLNCDCGNDFWYYKITPDGNTIVIDTSREGTDQTGYDVIYDLETDLNNNMFYGGSTTSWGSVDIAQGHSDAFINMFNNLYYTGIYVNNFGELGDDKVTAIDKCYDGGYVAIGDLNYNSTGGSNLFILKSDKQNSNGLYMVDVDLTNEDITLSIESNSGTENIGTIKVYPTFVKDIINIDCQINDFEIEIYALNGKMVMQALISNNQINVSSLPVNIYLLKITTKDNVYTTKFYKN